jgi:antitoxin VapB
LARALAERTGETLTEVVTNALRERFERELRKEQSVERLVEDVTEIGRYCASLPLLDRRWPDEILNYDENGLPRFD